MADLKRLQTAVEVGDREAAVEVTEQAVAEEILEGRARRHDRRDGRRRPALPGQRDLRAGDAHLGQAMKAAVALLEPCSSAVATSRTASPSWAPSRATSTTSARTSSA